MGNVMLDPHPRNELGRGTLDPGLEAVLLAEGYTFAMMVYPDPETGNKPFPAVCKRSIVDAITESEEAAESALLSARINRRIPAPTSVCADA